MFGTKGDPSRCWCQWFRMRNAEWRHASTAANKEALRLQVTARRRRRRVHPACSPTSTVSRRVGAPSRRVPSIPRLVARRADVPSTRAVGGDDLADPGVWSITCFVVRVGFRRKGRRPGIARRSAVDSRPRRSAHTIEGYPVDVDRQGRRSRRPSCTTARLSMFARRRLHRGGRRSGRIRGQCAARARVDDRRAGADDRTVRRCCCRSTRRAPNREAQRHDARVPDEVHRRDRHPDAAVRGGVVGDAVRAVHGDATDEVLRSVDLAEIALPPALARARARRPTSRRASRTTSVIVSPGEFWSGSVYSSPLAVDVLNAQTTLPPLTRNST